MRYLETLRRMYWISRLKHQGQASFADKLRWWRHGFRPSSAQMYRFPRADMHQYVSDYAENYGSLHLNPVESVFNHKALQQSVLQAAGAVMPELVAVLYGGRAVLHPLTPRARPVGAAELANALVAGGGEYIIKPDCGGGGDKVALLQVEEGAVVRSDGHDRAVFDAEAWGKQVMLIQRRAEPAAFWRDLWPGSSIPTSFPCSIPVTPPASCTTSCRLSRASRCALAWRARASSRCPRRSVCWARSPTRSHMRTGTAWSTAT